MNSDIPFIIDVHKSWRSKLAKREQAPSTVAIVEEKLVDFAEDLGRIFGSAQAKAAAWLDQRQNILQHLTQVRDKANDLIHTLTGDGTKGAATGGARRGRPVGSRNAVKRGPGRPPKVATAAMPVQKKRRSGLSEEGRAAIAAAQKARWAAIKAAKRK